MHSNTNQAVVKFADMHSNVVLEKLYFIKRKKEGARFEELKKIHQRIKSLQSRNQ